MIPRIKLDQYEKVQHEIHTTNNIEMKQIKFLSLFFFLAMLLMTPQSCTNLDETIYSDLDGDKFFSNPENIASAFGVAYTNLYWTMGHKYGVGRDCGTDILCVPQRGGDWLDGGEWHRYHRLTMTPKEAYVEFWWNLLYSGVNTCNRLILGFDQLGLESAKPAIAELRAFRAFYYWYLMDLYGNVPLVTSFDVPTDFAPSNNSRVEIYNFIEEEINAVLPELSKETGRSIYSRMNYYAAQMLLAKLYINAEVYTGTAQWAKAETALDAIISSGEFALEADYFANFADNADASKESIFAVPMDEVLAQGLEVHLFSLHYSLQQKFQLTQLPWNGLTAQEKFFNLFAATDKRRNGLLFGPQYDANGVQITDPSFEKFNPANPTLPRDPDGAGLNLTPALNMLEPNCLRQAGARIIKYFPTPGTGRYMSNDVQIFRYADALLMKAEVMVRLGNAAGAAEFFNMVRTRAGVAAIAAPTLNDLLDERARELYAEGYRRNDLIRFDKFLEERWGKPAASPETAILWPIPQTQIDNNPNLQQNPGYN